MLIGVLTKTGTRIEGLAEKVCVAVTKILVSKPIPGELKATEDASSVEK